MIRTRSAASAILPGPEPDPEPRRTREHRDPVPRRGRLRDRLAVPGHRGDAPGPRRLRHVPGLAGGDRAQPDAVRVRAGLARRGAPDARPSRPLRTGSGPRTAGFTGPIHATRGTVDLAEIVLRDRRSCRSSSPPAGIGVRRERPRPPPRPPRAAATESEAVATDLETDDPSLPDRLRNAPPEGRTETREPLYDEHDVDRAMELMRGCDYGDEVALGDGVSAVFHDAGHILGSAIIELRIGGRRRSAHDRLLRRPRT